MCKATQLRGVMGLSDVDKLLFSHVVDASIAKLLCGGHADFGHALCMHLCPCICPLFLNVLVRPAACSEVKGLFVLDRPSQSLEFTG